MADAKQVKRPNSRRNLDSALERLYGKAAFPAKRAVMANAIVAQMLPDGSVKGGSAIKMRLGDGVTRYTTDLIDLQLIDAAYSGDYANVKVTCERLFAYRKMQAWPPVIAAGPDWENLYSRQLPAGDLLPTVNEAVAWANELIARIDAS